MRNLFQEINVIENREPEEVIYETRLHWISFLPYIVGMLFTLPSLFTFVIIFFTYVSKGVKCEDTQPFEFVGLFTSGMFSLLFFFLLYKYFLLKSIKVQVLKNSLTLRSGVVAQEVNDILLSKYEGFHLHQSAMGKWLGYGIFRVTTGGAYQSYKIKDPMGLRNTVMNQINEINK